MNSTAGASQARDQSIGACPPPGPGAIGAYRLHSELGRGGMGVVHLATDQRGRAVAVKVLREHVADDPAARARLAREVAHLSRIQHAGVAGIVDADVTGPRPYIVTRYVPGPALDRYVAQHGPLRAEELLGLARDLSDALSAVHAVGVVHRDLKPANVLLHDGRPVLIDFGIAHATDDARLTSTGLVMGTPGFLAPEILDGAQVTAATDWWAWAATLAFAASGRVPFGDGPVDAVLARIRGGECNLSGVDPRLAPLLRAALDPRPAARPTQAQILAELTRYAAGGVPTETLPAHPLVPRTEVLPKVAPTATVPTIPGPGWPAGSPDHRGTGWPDPGLASGRQTSWGPPARPYPAAAAHGPADVYGPAASHDPAGAYGPRDPAASHRPATGHGPAWDQAPWPTAAAGPGGAGQVPAPRQGAPVPGAGSPYPASPQHARRTAVIAAGGLLLAAVTLVAPVAALGVGILWSWLARTVERAVVGLSLRRGEFGVRRGDVAGAVLRSPAYAVGAALGSVFAAILPALAGSGALVGAVALQGAHVLPGSARDASAPAPLIIAAAAALLVSWWGPGGATLRRGTRVSVRAASPGRRGPVIVTAVILLVAAVIGLISQSSGFEPSWAPLRTDPFRWVRVMPQAR